MKIGSGKLKLALICVRELQKLDIYLTQVNQENDHTSMMSITPRSYANGRHDRSCENTVCGDAMDSCLCSPSLDSRPFEVHAEIARSWVRLGPSLVYPVRG